VPDYLREHGRDFTLYLLLPDASWPETGTGVSFINRVRIDALIIYRLVFCRLPVSLGMQAAGQHSTGVQAI